MWNVKAKMLPAIIWAIGTISKALRQYLSNKPESTDSRNCKKQPYWSLHTYCGNWWCKNTKHI